MLFMGIGIITYRRPMMLKGCLARIAALTRQPYSLVVAEDGGEDSSYSLCQQLNITTVTGKNRGVSWNKNRALYTLISAGADPVLLLEDDCWPNKSGWEDDWIKSATLWQHVNYTLSQNWPSDWCRGGRGTAEHPWLGWQLTGQATITLSDALSKVGYLNTLFKGYGYAHIEWTERFCKAGILQRGLLPSLNLGLSIQKSATFRNNNDVIRNLTLFRRLQKEPFRYQAPWQNEREEDELKREVEKAIQLNPVKISGAP